MTASGALFDGRFALLEPLPDQGHGEVWKARDTKVRNRLVAVKRVGATAGALDDALGRRLKGFRHGAVLAVLHHGVADGAPYLAHELFEAPSLASVLAQSWRDDAPLPRAALEALSEKLCAALAAAHALEPPLVHGALRAEGVLVQRDAPQGLELRVTDVGLGPRAGAAEGARADVASLGRVLRAAFAAQEAPGRGPASAGRDWRRDDVPDAVWAAVERATSPRVAERFADVASLQLALEDAWQQPASGPAARPTAQAVGEVARTATEVAAWKPAAAPAAPAKAAGEVVRTATEVAAWKPAPVATPSSAPQESDAGATEVVESPAWARAPAPEAATTLVSASGGGGDARAQQAPRGAASGDAEFILRTPTRSRPPAAPVEATVVVPREQLPAPPAPPAAPQPAERAGGGATRWVLAGAVVVALVIVALFVASRV